MKKFLLLAVVGCCLTFTSSSTSQAQVLRRTALSVGNRWTANASSGWYPYVIARGEDRAMIRSTPMEFRPNRPMHFWGNSRRRMR